MSGAPWTGLAEAINAIRQELISAQELGAGSLMPLEVGAVEMEFSVTLSKDTTASGGVKVWVLEAGAEHSRAREQVHRVVVTLQPRSKGGRPVELSG